MLLFPVVRVAVVDMADPLLFSGDVVLHPVEDVAGNAHLGHAGCSGPAQVVGGEVCDPQPVFNGTLGGMGKVGARGT